MNDPMVSRHWSDQSYLQLPLEDWGYPRPLRSDHHSPGLAAVRSETHYTEKSTFFSLKGFMNSFMYGGIHMCFPWVSSLHLHGNSFTLHPHPLHLLAPLSRGCVGADIPGPLPSGCIPGQFSVKLALSRFFMSSLFISFQIQSPSINSNPLMCLL